MKRHHLLTTLTLIGLLAGCATGRSGPQLAAVRTYAAEASQLSAFTALTVRYRDTYQREQPYLSASALATERATDGTRRAAYGDFIQIKQAVQVYMETLGKLAGDDRYALDDDVRKLGAGIKAWPDSGLNPRHVQAYTVLARLVTRSVTGAYQDRAVSTMVLDGADAVQSLLDAMTVLLRYYDKSSDNEKAIVLGLFEVSLPFTTTPQDRLLATLAKVSYQQKTFEYQAVGQRSAQTARHLRAIAAGHQALVAHLTLPADGPARQALAAATTAIAASRAAIDAPAD